MSPVCPTLMMVEGKSAEGGAVTMYSLPVLRIALGLAFAATVLLALGLREPAGDWVLPILAVPALLAVILASASSRGRSRPAAVSPSPEDVFRTRYALGEITQQQYQDGLVEILKERYVQGIIGLEEYERSVARVYSWKGTAGERSTTGGTKR